MRRPRRGRSHRRARRCSAAIVLVGITTAGIQYGDTVANDGRVILLVDDDPNDVELMLRAFRNDPLARRLVVVQDGFEALEYLFCTGRYAQRDPTDEPKVVLLDLNLPAIDGLEVLRRIRADPRFRKLPVVILTSSDADQDKLAGYELGANSYVRKPVDFREFADAVTRLGLYWMVVNESPPRR